MPKLELNFQGLFSITLDGEPVTSFESNKVRALLAYLAVEAQRPHARESLATLLWPDWPDSAARSNLRYALADLRKAIGDHNADPPFLLTSRDAIQFNLASDHDLDAAEITALASKQEDPGDIERLERAVARYKGEFLEGFSISDASPFEDWARLKREQLHRANLQGLHRLAALLERSGDLERALTYARRQVELEPLDESAQRQVMRLLALSGRKGEALAQYEAFRDFLLLELDAAPSAETTGLYEQIRSGGMESPAPIMRTDGASRLPASLQGEGPERPVFVAREAELERLDALLQSTLSGDGQVVFITGEAGRGKTALLREFAYRASEAAPDLLAVSGGCNPYSGVRDPYLPLRSALRMLVGDIELARSSGMFTQLHLQRLWQAAPQALQALLSYGSLLVDTFISGNELLTYASELGVDQTALRQFVERAANRSSELAQHHVFEQYCGVLRAVARDHPLLVLLDDMHWSDAASAGLLYHLGTRLEGVRILVLCTYRPEELVQADGGPRLPLEKTLAELKRRYGDAWLNLTESDERHGRVFVDAYLDSQPNRLDQGFRQQLFQHTGGHALFTVELLRAMQERGDLVRAADGYWVAGFGLNIDRLPARVEAVIAERVGRLSEGQRQTLSIACIEGEDFTAQVTATLKGVDEGQMLRELSQELEKRHRLVSEQGEVLCGQYILSRYRFAHALYQQYLYNQLSEAERRLLHRATAQALEELYAGHEAEIAPKLAYHWGRAKVRDKAREYLILAGQAALGAYANADAGSYFRQALALDPGDRQRAALLGGLGEALRREAQHDEAFNVIRQGIAIYHQLGDQAGAAGLYRRLSRLLWIVNPLDAWNACKEGLDLLEEAPDSPEVAGLLAEAGRVAHFMFDAAEIAADDLCRRAIAMAERVADFETQAEAKITLAEYIGDHGGIDECLRMLESEISFCETHGFLMSAARAHHNLAVRLARGSIDVHSSSQHELRAAGIYRQIGDLDMMMFFCLFKVSEIFAYLGNLSSLSALLAEFLGESNAPPEQIRLFLEYIDQEMLYYRGEWALAVEYQRASLVKARNQKQFQDIVGCNFFLAKSQYELHRFTGRGDLSEAENALLEALEIDHRDNRTQVQLVAVYSQQHRFAEAHTLMAEIYKGPTIFRLEAKTDHALAEQRWDQAASTAQSLINMMQSAGDRWHWARRLIDLGEIYSHRGHPGDLVLAREAYQQSLKMFSEMEASGYIQVLKERLHSLPQAE